jgi:hypothetical protein
MSSNRRRCVQHQPCRIDYSLVVQEDFRPSPVPDLGVSLPQSLLYQTILLIVSVLERG